jgi:hypothetical protein
MPLAELKYDCLHMVHFETPRTCVEQNNQDYNDKPYLCDEWLCEAVQRLVHTMLIPSE